MSVLGDIGPRTSTPQGEQADPRQVKNSAGGYTFEMSHWGRLERFLVLGVDAGTFYVKARSLAVDNAKVVSTCLDDDPKRTVDTAAAISLDGRAPNNDPAVFVLAMAMAHPRGRAFAQQRIADICRIGTHLYHFATFVEGQRGWGRGLRRAVSSWYEREDVERLAYQAVKYRQRDGWMHRDLLRLAHPDAPSEAHRRLYDFICRRPAEDVPCIVEGYVKLNKAKGVTEAADLIEEYKLPWECVPSELLRDQRVWYALLMSGALPLGALVRNLGVMTHRGVIGPNTEGTDTVTGRLSDSEAIRKARLHPISALNALVTYKAGKGDKGKLAWSPSSKVIDALDAAFYTAFGSVEPAGKRTMLAIDISGSMTWHPCVGAAFDAREGAGAMAMVTAATEPETIVTAFTSGGYSQLSRQGYRMGISVADISPRRRLDDNIHAINNMMAGGTDCALPMIWATEEGVDVDTFVVYTDNETWAGNIHPHQALRRYREKRGIDARLIVVGMVSTGFTIADPSDPGMLDVVGFDTKAPSVMSDFSAGRF